MNRIDQTATSMTSASPASPSLPSDHPLASLSFMLEASLAQFQSEIRDHVAALVFGSLSVTDFLSYQPFLSFSTLECLLCFSSHRLNEILTFIMKMREQPLHIAATQSQLISQSSSQQSPNDPYAPVIQGPNLSFVEPAKNILLLRTMLILASHAHNNSNGSPVAAASTALLSSSIYSMMSSLLSPSQPGILTLSSGLCSFLELSALHFFVSPLPSSPPMTRWKAFVHIVTGGVKKKERRMRHVKGGRDALKESSLTAEQREERDRIEAIEEEERLKSERRREENASELLLSSHDRLTLLFEELQQLWAAVLGMLSVRCDRATTIIRLFLPHLACSLPTAAARACNELVNERHDKNNDSNNDKNDSELFNSTASTMGILTLTQSLPSLPPVALPHSSHPLPTLTALIRGLSLLQLSIDTRATLNLSHSLVSTMAQLLTNKSTANATRRELGLAISSLLFPLSLSAWSPNLSYRQWFSLTSSLYNDSKLWVEKNDKAKNHIIASPLLVATLCACDPETFIRHFSSTITALLTAYHQHRRSKDSLYKEASAMAIDSLQRLLHVYLLQRSSRHETTLTNLEHIHQSFLLTSSASSSISSLLSNSSEEENYSWMKGSTQAGLVALILTAAKADPNFAAHEIVLPMMESQEKRRLENEEKKKKKGKTKAGTALAVLNNNEEKEGVSGQVVTGLRALAAILCVDDDEDREASLISQNNVSKQPSPLLAQPQSTPPSLHATLANLRQSLTSPLLPISFFNAHAPSTHGKPIPYLHRLTSILGTILSQCDEILGNILLIDEFDLHSELEDRHANTLSAMRLILRIIGVVWPTAQPVATVVATLVRAALHLDAAVRAGSRGLLLQMMKRDGRARLAADDIVDEIDDSRQQSIGPIKSLPIASADSIERGSVIMAIVHQLNHLPTMLASSHDHQALLTDLLAFIADLLRGWLTSSTCGSDSFEGLLVHHVEAAVGVWLAAVHPGIRLAACAVLLLLRALAHHIQGKWRYAEPAVAVTAKLKFPFNDPTLARLAPVFDLYAGSASSIVGAPSHLIDIFTVCRCHSLSQATSLSFDSLLSNHECLACGHEPRSADTSNLILSITEQLKRDEAKEKREKRQQEREERGIQIHFSNEEEMEDGVSTLSASSASRLYPIIHDEDNENDEEDSDEIDEKNDNINGNNNGNAEVDEVELHRRHAAIISKRQAEQSLPSLLSSSSEWRWTALLAHWMRAVVHASECGQHQQLKQTLQSLFSLIEQRLAALTHTHTTLLAKRGRGLKIIDSDEKLLESHGMNSLSIAVLKNLSIMAVVAVNSAFAVSNAFLSQALVPLIQSPFAVIRRLASLAMGNAHQTLAPQLLTLLSPIEAACNNSSKQPHKDDVTRSHLAHVYRLMAESFKLPSSITQQASSSASSSSFIVRVLKWIRDTYMYLGVASNEFRWDLMELRRHFCVVVERVALATAQTEAEAGSKGDSHFPPIDASFRRALFDLFHAWCGYGPSASSYRSKVESHKSSLLQRLRSAVSDEQKVQALAESFQIEMKSFQLCALSAMAALIKFPCHDQSQAAVIFDWLKDVLTSRDAEVRDIAYRALEWFILHNESRMSTLIDHCYHEHTLLARRYFLVLGQLLLLRCQGNNNNFSNSANEVKRNSNLPSPSAIEPASINVTPGSIPFGLSLPTILHLCVFKLGDPSYNVRAIALKLLPVIEARCAHLTSSRSSSMSVIIGSHLADTYRQVQTSLSQRLALTFAKLSDEFILESIHRFDALRTQENKSQVLNYMAPWCSNVRLTLRDDSIPSLPDIDDYLGSEHSLINGEEWENKTNEEKLNHRKNERSEFEAASAARAQSWCFPSTSVQHLLIDSMISLTANHSHYASKALETLWVNLAHTRDNVSIILVALLSIMRANQLTQAFEERLATYKRIALYSSRANPRVTIWKLVQFIHRGEASQSQSANDPNPASFSSLTMSHFSLLLLVEVAYEIDFSHFDRPALPHRAANTNNRASINGNASQPRSQATVDVLSVLLHIGVLGIAHSVPFIRHYSSVLLINIVHATAFKPQHVAAHTPQSRLVFAPSRNSNANNPSNSNNSRLSVNYSPLSLEERRTSTGRLSFPSPSPETINENENGNSNKSGPSAHQFPATSAYSTLTAAFSSARSRLSSAPSAGLSLAIAESQQIRVLGLRQRRALLLMNQLNDSGSINGVGSNGEKGGKKRRMSRDDNGPTSHTPLTFNSSTGGAANKENHRPSSPSIPSTSASPATPIVNDLNELIQTLLRVVPESHGRSTLSRRWFHHSINWAVCSPSIADCISSHRIYRALNPPLIVTHYWKVVNGLENFVQQWKIQRRRESLPAKPNNKKSGGQVKQSQQQSPRVSGSLYEALLTLQHMVARLGIESNEIRLSQAHRRTSSAIRTSLPLSSSALRSQLLPSLFWSSLSILQQCFIPDVPLASNAASDESLLITCIDLVSVLLSVVAEERSFEAAVYEYRNQTNGSGDSQQQFVGVLPLMIRGLLPPLVSSYETSFPCLNLLGGTRTNIPLLAQSPLTTTLSPAVIAAIFGFLSSFNPLPSSPLCGLLDISSFAQRMLPSLLLQLPWICVNIDTAQAKSKKEGKLLSATVADSEQSNEEKFEQEEPRVQIPCSHPHQQRTPAWLAANPVLMTACSQWSSLFSQLGLMDIAIVFACCSAGHFNSASSFLQAVTGPLLAILPASTVYHSCLLLLDWMERQGAFVAVDASFHAASEPKAARVYAQQVGQKAKGNISTTSSSASNSLTSLISMNDSEFNASSFNQQSLCVIALILSQCDWRSSGLSSPQSQPLFQRLHMLLYTELAPLASQVLGIALNRAELSVSPSQSSPPSSAHALAASVINPAIPEASRYQPNPRVSTRPTTPNVYPQVEPELPVNAIVTPSQRVMDDLRASGLLNRQPPMPSPSAPAASDDEMEQKYEEVSMMKEKFRRRSSSISRKVQFVIPTPNSNIPRAVGSNSQNRTNRRPSQAIRHRYQIDDDDDEDTDEDDNNDSTPMPSLPSAYHIQDEEEEKQQISPARPTPQPLVKSNPIANKLAAIQADLNKALSRQPIVTATRHRRDDSMTVDVSIHIPMTPENKEERKEIPQLFSSPSLPTGGLQHSVKSRPKPAVQRKKPTLLPATPATSANPHASDHLQLPSSSPISAPVRKPAVPVKKPTVPRTVESPRNPLQDKLTQPRAIPSPTLSPLRSPMAFSEKRPMEKPKPKLVERQTAPKARVDEQQRREATFAALEADRFALSQPSLPSHSHNVSTPPRPPRPAAATPKSHLSPVGFTSPLITVTPPSTAANRSPMSNSLQWESNSLMDISGLRQAMQQRDVERDRLQQQQSDVKAKLRALGVRRPESLAANNNHSHQQQLSPPDYARQSIRPCTFHSNDGDDDDENDADASIVQIHNANDTLQLSTPPPVFGRNVHVSLAQLLNQGIKYHN